MNNVQFKTVGDSFQAWREGRRHPSTEVSVKEVDEKPAPEVIEKEKESPEFLDLKKRIVEYEKLVDINPGLSIGDDGDVNLPMKGRVLSRQRRQMHGVKESLNADVAAIFRAAKNREESKQLLDLLRETVKDQVLLDQLLNHHARVLAEKDSERKNAPRMDNEINEPRKEKVEEGGSNIVPGKVDIPAENIRLDSPDVGDSFLAETNPAKVMLDADEGFAHGLEQSDPLLGDAQSSGHVDRIKIQEERAEAAARMAKMTDAEKDAFLSLGMKVTKPPSMDSLVGGAGFGSSGDAETTSSPGQGRAEGIETGFFNDEKSDVPEAKTDKSSHESGAVRINEIKKGLSTDQKTAVEEPHILEEKEAPGAETTSLEDRKKEFKKTVQRITEQDDVLVEKVAGKQPETVHELAKKPEPPRKVLVGIYREIAGDKKVGANVLARMQKRIMKTWASAAEAETTK